MTNPDPVDEELSGLLARETAAADLERQACPDCRPTIGAGRGHGIGGPLTLVTVHHAPDCPWAHRHLPTGQATLGSHHGIVVHYQHHTHRTA